MKTTIILTIILNTLLFSDNVFDISRPTFGLIKFNTEAKMRIYTNGKTAFNLPIEIFSYTEPIKKIKTGYLRKSTFEIRFTAIKTNKMTINTQTITEFDTNYRLTKLTEKISRNGEQKTVVCTPLSEVLIEKDYKKHNKS